MIDQDRAIQQIDDYLSTQPTDNATLNEGKTTFTSGELGDAWQLSHRPTMKRIRNLIRDGFLEPAWIRRVNTHGLPHSIRGYIYLEQQGADDNGL